MTIESLAANIALHAVLDTEFYGDPWDLEPIFDRQISGRLNEQGLFRTAKYDVINDTGGDNGKSCQLVMIIPTSFDYVYKNTAPHILGNYAEEIEKLFQIGGFVFKTSLLKCNNPSPTQEGGLIPLTCTDTITGETVNYLSFASTERNPKELTLLLEEQMPKLLKVAEKYNKIFEKFMFDCTSAIVNGAGPQLTR